MNFSNKHLIGIFLLFSIVLFTVQATIEKHIHSQQGRQVALDNAVKKSAEGEKIFKTYLEKSRQTASTIFETQAFQSYLASGEVDILSRAFLLIAKNNEEIMKIRLIDDTGNEKIHIDRHDIGSLVRQITGDRLQDQSDRDFVKDGFALTDNNDFIAEIDLHIENGKIEIPVKETFRVVFPYTQNQKTNLLVIDYFARPFLNHLMNASLYRQILVDSEGEILTRNDGEKGWSRYQDQAQKLTELTPLAQELLNQVFYRNDNLVARKLELPFKKPLYLVLSLSPEFIEQQDKNEFEKILTEGAVIILLTLILGLLVLKIFKALNITLADKTKHLELLENKNTEIIALLEENQAFLEMASDGVHIMDIEGNVVLCSQSFADSLGYSMEEVLRLNIRDWDALVPSDELKQALRAVLTAPQVLETQHKRKNGTTFDVEIHAKGIHLNHDQYIYASSRDISEKKVAEKIIRDFQEQLNREVVDKTAELLLAKDKAEAANTEKSRFLANMSHELRTPMHSILSFAALGLKKTGDKKAARYFDNINQSASRLMRLINGLLDISKLESGKMEVNPSVNNLKALIDQQLQSLGSLFQDKQIQTKHICDDQIEGFFDANLISQVITNILSNAIKFSPENSIIEINCGREGGNLYCRIIDEGIGIPDDEVDAIFDRFIESSHTKSKAGGTGLGLSISQEIIKLHHGKIWAVSPPIDRKSGTQIEFSIPAQHGIEQNQSTEKSERIEWINDFNIGIPLIDKHHKKILSIINHLYDTGLKEEPGEELHTILNELHHYIDYHFKYEENLMEQSQYPDHGNHSLEHEHFIEKINFLGAKTCRGDKDAIHELNHFLSDWWHNHILNEDMKYSAHVFDYLYGEEDV